MLNRKIEITYDGDDQAYIGSIVYIAVDELMFLSVDGELFSFQTPSMYNDGDGSIHIRFLDIEESCVNADELELAGFGDAAAFLRRKYK